MNKPIRLLIVEDHPVFGEGLRLILSSEPDMEVVSTVPTAEEAIVAFRHHKPDIVLMDQRLPGASGIDATRTIKAESSGARIVMLTTSEGDAEIQRALQAGAVAYLLKSASMEEIVTAIRKVHRGHKYVHAAAARRIAEHMGQESLSERELQVIELIKVGKATKEIAAALKIAEATVSFHIRNIKDKLQVSDKASAVAAAIRRGLIEA